MDRHQRVCSQRLITGLLLLLIAAPAPSHAVTPPPQTELAASYRFLVSDRETADGILVPAATGPLQGRPLPLSFRDSAAYWGEHVCRLPGIECGVIDIYNPQTYTLTPRPSPSGDLQTERVNVHNGANIYDAATWQIAVMLGRVANRFTLPDNGDAYALASNQNLRLQALPGMPAAEGGNGVRATTAGATFVYNRQAITDPARAYAFRMLPRTWLALDPFAGTPYSQYIATSDLPPHNPVYQPGRITWTDWKPITGENAWAFLLGPLQAAVLHYQDERRARFVPFNDPAIGNAIAILPTFAAMQSHLGAVYYAPAGTLANQGDAMVDPLFVAVENNLSLYAGLGLLQEILTATLAHDPALTPADRSAIAASIRLCMAMREGGVIGADRTTAGLLAFFRDRAWREGEFVQGGRTGQPTDAAGWVPALHPKAVDVNTWGLAALGPERIDAWFGFAAAWRNWQQVRRWGGYGVGRTLWGVGFSDQDGNGIDAAGNFRQGVLSVEWTAGAITAVRALAAHYRAVAEGDPLRREEALRYVSLLIADEQSMCAALERLRTDTYGATPFPGQPERFSHLISLSTKPYLYASRRHFIPFGWYANPLPSTCATAWMLMVANRFNPFVLGGGLR